MWVSTLGGGRQEAEEGSCSWAHFRKKGRQVRLVVRDVRHVDQRKCCQPRVRERSMRMGIVCIRCIVGSEMWDEDTPAREGLVTLRVEMLVNEALHV